MNYSSAPSETITRKLAKAYVNNTRCCAGVTVLGHKVFVEVSHYKNKPLSAVKIRVLAQDRVEYHVLLIDGVRRYSVVGYRRSAARVVNNASTPPGTVLESHDFTSLKSFSNWLNSQNPLLETIISICINGVNKFRKVISSGNNTYMYMKLVSESQIVE